MFYRISQLFNLSSDNNEPTVETKRVAHCSLLLLILVWTALCAIAIFAADLLYSGEWWILLLVNHIFLKINCKLRNSHSLPKSNYLQDVINVKLFIFQVCVLSVLLVCLLVVLIRQPRSHTHLPFKVLFVPLIPLISVMVNIYLVLTFSSLTWLRFAVWLVAGNYKLTC